MKKMKKRMAAAVCMMTAVIGLTGCSTSVSLTYNVDTGDTVEVTLDTTDNDFSLGEEDNVIMVTEDDDTILSGAFVYQDICDIYEEMIKADDTIEIIEEDSANGLTWLFYSVDGLSGVESNFIVWIDGSNTGVLLASLQDSDDAKKAFECLTFSIE